MSTRRSIATRHYYIGGFGGFGVMLTDTKPVAGIAMVIVAVAAQCVYQWRAMDEDLRAKRRAS